MAKCRIGTAKFFTLLLLLYRTSINAQGVNHGIELYGAIEAGCLLVFSYASFAGTMDFDRLLRPLCLAESA